MMMRASQFSLSTIRWCLAIVLAAIVLAPRDAQAWWNGDWSYRTKISIAAGQAPAGRMPVMAACLLSRMPIRRFARGCAPAALAWAACYQAIGILGGSLFAEPWRGLALAVGLTLLISVMPTAFRRVHRVRRVRGMREQHEP